MEAQGFPEPALPPWLDLPGRIASGLQLRLARADDLPFLRELYTSSRAAELACMPWPEQAKRAFCDSQFDLQHRHYLSYTMPGAFTVVMRDDRAVGRLYLQWTPTELHIVDILLLPDAQGQGIGSTLLRWLQSLLPQAGVASLALQVLQHNTAAHQLYRRLGFQAREIHGMHVSMAWTPPNASLS
ncbi:N-acetyltransferase family protein [Dyella kyungheensis]|jgi:ribosomal protein S18 acetylase RimI-like enzyme|uniref:GNAT family N-acetyltransferase n=1 Tax=Dyella kyungheensis TaxID=1242174 RepID=UPI003CF9CF7B